MEAFLGSIQLFAGNFAPAGWAFCDGAILQVSRNQALYSILGNAYGGTAPTTFALPDLRGRAAVSVGTGPGLSPVDLGQAGGVQSVTLTVSQMPSHTHTVGCNETGAGQRVSENNFPGTPSMSSEIAVYSATKNATMNATMIDAVGGDAPIATQSPFLGLNYIICLQGEYPARN